MYISISEVAAFVFLNPNLIDTSGKTARARDADELHLNQAWGSLK